MNKNNIILICLGFCVLFIIIIFFNHSCYLNRIIDFEKNNLLNASNFSYAYPQTNLEYVNTEIEKVNFEKYRIIMLCSILLYSLFNTFIIFIFLYKLIKIILNFIKRLYQ